VSSVTYPEIWRSLDGDAASAVGDTASRSGDLQISGYVTLLFWTIDGATKTEKIIV